MLALYRTGACNLLPFPSEYTGMWKECAQRERRFLIRSGPETVYAYVLGLQTLGLRPTITLTFGDRIMAKSPELRTLAAAIGTTFAVTLAISPIANAAENPFGVTQFQSGYMVAGEEGKCGGEKAAEGKCGGEKAADDKGAEGKCGGEKAADDKGAEGKCGGEKAADDKGAEGKCGN
jgi:uncharacterized low-complexity protein